MADVVKSALEASQNITLEVLHERWRQVESEGWSTAHDDAYPAGELAHAAAAYACSDIPHDAGPPPAIWPWARAWWKPSTRRRNLIKACALLVSEIERIDRAEANHG